MGYPKAERIECASFKDVGIREEFIGRYPRRFSGGQRRRYQRGRALALNPG